jgi:uroporphyrin-III C-methyltransferase / precorrin-2 dehydrogenase / sirohydrochlorin ferrochelatase
VRFVTGCAKTGQLPSGLDWHGLADPNTTTIFYMAGGTAGAIAERLIAAGCSSSLPAVMVSDVSRGDERWAGAIANLGWASERRDPSKPVIIGVGRVFERANQSSVRHGVDPLLQSMAHA